MNDALQELRARFSTQQEMADAIGVKQGTVADWLRDKSPKKPSIKSAKQIEERFGIPRERIRPDIYS